MLTEEYILKRLVRHSGSSDDQLRVAGVRLRKLVGQISLVIGCDLPALPELTSLSGFKQFCVGLLEPCVSHPWEDDLRRLSCGKRMTVASSLFLFRKTLPTPEDPLAGIRLLSKLSIPAPAPDPEFLKFCSKQIPKIFRRGWDSGFYGYGGIRTLPTSSTLESKRSQGGARGAFFGDHRPDVQLAVLASVGAGSAPPCPVAKVVVVRTKGKDRCVTVNSVSHHALGGLHRLMYDHISRQDWCLRGDAEPQRFSPFLLKKGEVFVSGDYESATDNLSLEVYRHLLKEVRRTCSTVPNAIWDFAESQSSLRLVFGEAEVQQARGQLMGSLLSFPFLCLTNYLAFKYFVRRHVPVRINGDDIVFRCTPGEADVWMKGVERTGLTLSRGKTLVDERFFSLNSTFFRATTKSVRYVPFLRPAAFFSRPETADALCGQYSAFQVGTGGQIRAKLRAAFLKEHANFIACTQRSVTRGLGMSASRTTLSLAGLWRREKYYLSLPKELRLPTLSSVSLPKGWRQIPYSSPEQLVEDKEFYKVLEYRSWLYEPMTDKDSLIEYWSNMRAGSFRYNKWDLGNNSRGYRLWQKLPCSIRGTGRTPCLRRLKPERRVWAYRPKEEGDGDEARGLWRRAVKFV